ncbi:MAG: lactate 2-monooxygenase [Myxococcota bacterium]
MTDTSHPQPPSAADFGRKRQSQVYIGGLGGRRPGVPVGMEPLEEAAQQAMTDEAYAYIACGAGSESTLRENRAAFERWRIVPRMLRDVASRDTRVELFGRTLDTPLLLAPIGVQEMAHPEADLATARAASAERVPMIFSNQASVSMETCAEAMGDAPRWFQLYWSTSDELVASLVSRAEACGCDAIVVTLDTTLLGWRIRDLDLAYLPFLRGKGIAQYVSDPVFRRLLSERSRTTTRRGEELGPRSLNVSILRALVELMQNYPDDWLSKLTSGEPLAAVQQFINIYSRPSLTWDDLAFLRDHTTLPILLKGIVHPDDARKALDYGLDGLVVSNHGGRQVDGAIGAFDALPDVVDAVEGRIPIVFDSGIRTGADVFKALAMGATAVGLGRPYVYGLAAGGELGVREVLQNFKADFDLTMGLAGCASIAEINRDSIRNISR